MASKQRRSQSNNKTVKNNKKRKGFLGFMNKGKVWQRIVKWFLLVLFIFALFGSIVVGAVVAKYKKGLAPVNHNTFYTAKASTNVFDRKGEYVGSLSLNNIRWIDLKDKDGNLAVSDKYLEGIIATEDKNFLSHGGVDYGGMVKATVSTVFSSNDRGGSSITMQLAKILYMQDWITPNEEGVDRRSEDKVGYKVTQMLYAHEIEGQFNKGQILENYINVVGFGNAGYGIVNAANYFYGKAPNQLDLNEAATLAGMSQLPAVYNPYDNPDATTERRNIVIDRMVAEKYISKEEGEATKALPINNTLVDPGSRPISNQEKVQGYLDVVYREFLEIIDPNKSGEFDVNTAGMNIYTNMDVGLQIGLYDILNSNNPNLFEDELIQTGVVLMDSNNGEVLAIGNGRNEHKGFLGTNFAYNYNRQPGSTAKPIVDAGPAIEYLDWSSAHPLEDKSITYDGGPEVHNADGKYLGWLTLGESLGKSRNTTALETFKQVSAAKGIDSIYNFVTGLGFDQINKDDFNQAYAIGGWQYGTTPYQLAGAYAAFGNGGVYNTPHTVNHIDIQPESIYYEKLGANVTPQVESKRVMKESTSYIMSQMLKSDQPYAKGYAPYSPAMPSLSVKTGTSDWGDSGAQYKIPKAAQRDKWVAGFNNNIALVTWTGYTQEHEKTGHFIQFNSEYEKNCYKAIVEMVAKTADKDILSNGALQKPENVIEKEAHVSEGKIVAGGSPNYFIKDSEDDNGLHPAEDAKTPIDLSISVDATNKKLSITWNYPEENKDGLEYIIYVDGKEVKRTTDLKVELTYDELVASGGCKSSYEITVGASRKTKDKDGNEQENVSPPTASRTVDFGSDEFCKTPATKPPTDEEKQENGKNDN